MLRFLAVLMGIVFIFGGVAGYLPAFMQNGLLFGYIEVNHLHNIIYIVTGVIAIMAATSYRLTKIFFILFGLIYLALGIYGIWQNGDLMVTHTNMAGNFFHTVVGIISLFLGLYGYRRVNTA